MGVCVRCGWLNVWVGGVLGIGAKGKWIWLLVVGGSECSNITERRHYTQPKVVESRRVGLHLEK